MKRITLALAAVLLTATLPAQQSILTTDFKMRRSSSTSGQYSFRHNGDGILRSYNAAGTQTASWNAETGSITGVGGGGGASALSDLTDVDLTGMAEGHVLRRGATTWESSALGIEDVTDLETELDGKAPTVHAHTIANVTGLQTSLDDIDTALDGKAPTSHNHVMEDVSDLEAALDLKADLTYVDSEVGTLETALAGKSDTGHTHAFSVLTGTASNSQIATGIDAAKLADGSVSNTEFQYINSLSSNAQTQISARLPATITAAATGEYIRYNGSAWVDAVIAEGDLPSSIDAVKIGGGGVTTTEFGYIGTLSSNAQTQIDTKAATTYVDSEVGTLETALTGKANLAGGNTFTGTQNISTLNVSTKFVPADAQVFEVSADGSREYSTIAAALAAATNAAVDKVIKVYPGAYSVGTAGTSQLIVSVDKTHIVGTDRESCVLSGAITQTSLKDSVIHFGADDCSISNMTVINSGPDAGPAGKWQALSVGEPDDLTPTADNFRAFNCSFIGEYLAGSEYATAADVVLINVSANNAAFESCFFSGNYDVCASFAPVAYVRNCTVASGGSAYFLAARAGTDYDPEAMGYLRPALHVTGGSVKGGSIITIGNAYAYLYNIGSAEISLPMLYEILPAGTSFNNIYTAGVASTGLGTNTASNPVSISHGPVSGTMAPMQIDPDISVTEFDYLNGLTGNIQTQLNAKPDTLAEVTGLAAYGSAGQVLATNGTANGYEWATVSSGGATNLDGLSDVVITAAASTEYLRHNGTNWVDASIAAGDLPSSIDATKIGGGGVTTTEFGYIGTLSSDAQTQITARLPATITAAATGEYIRYNGSAWVDASIAAGDLPSSIDATKIGAGGVTTTEFGYIGTLSSDAQTQLNARGTLTGTNAWSGANTFSSATNRFTGNVAFGGASSPSHSLVVGLDMGDIGFPTGKAVVIAHNASPGALLAVGQDATHQLQFRWDYAATANNAVANLVTYSYQNALNIDVSSLNMQQLSNGAVKIGSATSLIGFHGATPLARQTITAATTLEQLKQDLEDLGLFVYTP